MTGDKNQNPEVGMSDALLAAILDNVMDGIITIDESGAIRLFSKSAENIFGYTASEIIGSNVSMLMPEPFHSQHDGYLKNFIPTGQKKVIGIGRPLEGKHKDGSRFPMVLSVSEMNYDGKRMFTGIVRDISERLKTERIKSEFISTVSHELRTPLTSIHGALGLIAGGVGGELPAHTKSLIEIAYKNSERLILLVSDILDMENLESGKMEFQSRPVKLMPLLKRALEAIYAYAEQYKVRCDLKNEAPEVMVDVDSQRLLQSLTNLLSNAVKFSHPEGMVDIVVTSADNCVRVSVIDYGCGITEQFRSRIFQKFTQADSSDTRKKGGTGLGLSITKAIVERMGGIIGFDSVPNVRTTFFIEFPIWRETTSVSEQGKD